MLWGSIYLCDIGIYLQSPIKHRYNQFVGVLDHDVFGPATGKDIVDLSGNNIFYLIYVTNLDDPNHNTTHRLSTYITASGNGIRTRRLRADSPFNFDDTLLHLVADWSAPNLGDFIGMKWGSPNPAQIRAVVGPGGERFFELWPYSGTALVRALQVRGNRDVVLGDGALATGATGGFLHLVTMPGAPTGTPTLYTGRAPQVYDTANDRLYVYNGSWKYTRVGPRTSNISLGSGAFGPVTGSPSQTNTVASRYACWRLPDGSLSGIGTEFTVPADWVSGSLTFVIDFVMEAETTGNVRLSNLLLAISDGQNAAAGPVLAEETIAVPTSSLGVRNLKRHTLAATLAVSAGQLVFVTIRRDGAHAEDTATGGLDILNVEVRYTAN
jgi:hypothetical protein